MLGAVKRFFRSPLEKLLLFVLDKAKSSATEGMEQTDNWRLRTTASTPETIQVWQAEIHRVAGELTGYITLLNHARELGLIEWSRNSRSEQTVKDLDSLARTRSLDARAIVSACALFGKTAEDLKECKVKRHL